MRLAFRLVAREKISEAEIPVWRMSKKKEKKKKKKKNDKKNEKKRR